jgi:ABC-type cobalamin transport system ATPase subunit
MKARGSYRWLFWILLAVILIAVALWKILPPYLDCWKSAQDYQNMAEEYVTEEASPDDEKQKKIFLDEPTTYLDIRYQIEILQLVKKLNQEFGITIIMVLHDINQAIAYSDNVIGMKDGRVLVEGDPEEVITEESIRELYGIELGITHVDGQKFVLAV